jgi:hypothetical protein
MANRGLRSAERHRPLDLSERAGAPLDCWLPVATAIPSSSASRGEQPNFESPRISLDTLPVRPDNDRGANLRREAPSGSMPC